MLVVCFVLKESLLRSHWLPKVDEEFEPFRDPKTPFYAFFELSKFSSVK